MRSPLPSPTTLRVAADPANDAPYRLINNVEFGEGVIVFSFTNLYGCRIGAGTRVGPFVEIQRGAVVGENCKIQSHAFICDGVEIQSSTSSPVRGSKPNQCSKKALIVTMAT